MAGLKSLPYGRDVSNEWGAYIYEDQGKYFVSAPIEGGPQSLPLFSDITTTNDVNGNITGLITSAGGHQVVETLHTHVVGEAGLNLSSGDVQYAERFRVNMSLRSRSSVRTYDHTVNNTRQYANGNRYKEHPGVGVCRGKDCGF